MNRKWLLKGALVMRDRVKCFETFVVDGPTLESHESCEVIEKSAYDLLLQENEQQRKLIAEDCVRCELQEEAFKKMYAALDELTDNGNLNHEAYELGISALNTADRALEVKSDNVHVPPTPKPTITEELLDQYQNQAEAEHAATGNPWAYRYLVHMQNAVFRIKDLQKQLQHHVSGIADKEG